MVEASKVEDGAPVPVAYGAEPQEENKNQRRNAEAENELLGNWAWKNDGAKTNGDIVLLPDGELGHKCNWTGTSWEVNARGQVKLNFNGVLHTMELSEDKKHMILVNPMRHPPSVASFESALAAEDGNPMIEGHWDWKQDGVRSSGGFVLKPGGVVEHEGE